MNSVAVHVIDVDQVIHGNDSPVEDEALVALKSVVLAKESKMRNLLTLKKLCMKSIIGSFNIDPSSPLILGISDIFSLLPAALCQEFLNFITCLEYFHEQRSNLVHLAILLVNSNTISLDVRRLFETTRCIDADVEQRVVKKVMETSWKLRVLVVENLPDILLQPFQPIATLRHLEIWGTELSDSHIGMIARNAPNLVILKVCLDINLTTVDSLVHLQWLRCLEEFVVLRSCEDKYFHFLRRILHFMPHLKVAGAKADHYDAIKCYHDVLTHCVPLGHMKLPLEHLFVGSENLSPSQAKMLPKLKAFCVNLGDFELQPVPDSLLKFPELECLSLNELPSTSSALEIVLQVYGNGLKKLFIGSTLVPIDVMQTLTCCPFLEELRVHSGSALIPSSPLPNLEVMNSLVSVNIHVRSGKELPRKLFPRIMASPHLHDIVLKCNSINAEDRRLVRSMAEAGDYKKLEDFQLEVHKPLSDSEKVDYELMTYSVFAFSPAFKFRQNCCTFYMFHY